MRRVDMQELYGGFLPRSHGTPGQVAPVGGCGFIDLSVEVLDFKQNRHPERSASQIYRLTEGFWRGVEGPRGWLLADALQSFPAP